MDDKESIVSILPRKAVASPFAVLQQYMYDDYEYTQRAGGNPVSLYITSFICSQNQRLIPDSLKVTGSIAQAGGHG